MGKIVAIDYGKARCGIAETDDMQIIASGLVTVSTSELIPFLQTYVSENQVDAFVIGLPTDLKGNLSEIETDIQKSIKVLHATFPTIKVERFDERFTSKMASFFISKSGKSKKKRQEKGLIDKVSATLILQNYLEQKTI